ncbi:MAG: rRNA maturation RNase YbeY [Lachnospiraceae bacterium]|nr:rRNA maturation RNase YbeY [Lachnospiraceae bacterium]
MNFTLYTECETAFSLDFTTIANAVADVFFKRFPCPYDVQLSLYVVEDETIRQANKDMRGIDKVTDVLSFPNLPFDPEHVNDFELIEEDDADVFDPESGELIYGEIMICASKVFLQAEEYGHSPEREFAFLTAHSLLHLTGFDHMEEEDRLKMESMQEDILKEAGYERG